MLQAVARFARKRPNAAIFVCGALVMVLPAAVEASLICSAVVSNRFRVPLAIDELLERLLAIVASRPGQCALWSLYALGFGIMLWAVYRLYRQKRNRK